MYLNSKLHRLLTDEASDAIEDLCWRGVFSHSFIGEDEPWPLNNPSKSVCYISGSENHCADQRMACLLSLQVLRQAGEPYGPMAKLLDGFTVEQHYQEWVKWYPEYFQAWMREGLICEIAHPSSDGAATISSHTR